MTGVFTPARQLRVFIGADAQDWSACAGRFVPGKASLGEDGLLGISATLEIQTNLLNPESTDPENNPARWRPGQLVRVQVPNAAGTFIDHPQGWLYLLKEPTLDDETNILPLELGCWLAWGDSQEPADDVSAVQVGTVTDYSVIAQRYLEAAGIPSASISLGGPWGYATAAPQPKPSGSYVAKAAELAYAAGFRVLYQGKDGVVRSQAVTTTAGTPDLTLNLNTQNLRFRRLADPQEPFEVIRVAGTGVNATTQATPVTNTESGTGIETYTEESYDLAEDELIGRGAIVAADPDRTASRRTRLRFRQAGEEVFEVGGSSALVVSDDTTELFYYQATNGTASDAGVFPYRLFYKFKYSDRARGIGDGDDNATTERYREIGTNYSFDADGRVAEIEETEWAREKEFDPTTTSIQWRVIRETTQTWTREGTGQYSYRNTERIARIVANQNAGTQGRDKWQLIQPRPADYKPAQGQGKNEPPNAETWDGPYLLSEANYEGEVTWVHRGGATGRTRTRTFQLPDGLAVSNAQCEAIAAIHRDLLAGRKRSRLIQLALSDALLALDTPLPQIEVLCLDGWTRTYLLDAVAFEHQSDRAFCEALGILIEEVAP